MILRAIRRRFGISARQVAVRAKLPWYVGALIAVVVGLVVGGLGLWVFDAGRRFAGFDEGDAKSRIEQLETDLSQSRAQLAGAQRTAAAADSQLQVERATQKKLVEQVQALERELGRYREDLAFFEGLVPAQQSAQQSVAVARFRVDREAVSGRYRYRLLLVRGGNQRKETEVRIGLLLNARDDSKNAILKHSKEQPSEIRASIKNFRRIDGIFEVPPGKVLVSVQVRVTENGIVVANQVVSVGGT